MTDITIDGARRTVAGVVETFKVAGIVMRYRLIARGSA
jgi:hypothetical protein